MTVGGIEALEERRKRRGLRSITSFWRDARVSTSWCIVGTAVYQLGLHSSIQLKNLKASKPGDVTTDAPALREASIAAIRPWMWNSGMTFRQRSAGVRARASRMLPAEITRLRWLRGTILGRAVVPEVWSTRATSSDWANTGVWGGTSPPSRCNVYAPASPVRARRMTSAPAAAWAASASPGW